MIVRFKNGTVVLAEGIAAEVDVAISGGLVRAINPAAQTSTYPERSVDLDGGWLLPGFVDVQVNGGGGVLFNDDPSVGAITDIAEAHARFGTTGFLPTLVSDSAEKIEAALAAADTAIELGVPGVLGAHIEGPFISSERRGIHDDDMLRPLDQRAIELLTRPRRGKVMVTLAPEVCELADIQTLVDHGVVVSLGHSNATYEQAMAAVGAGARAATHLFNAMSPLRHREPGVVGAALDSDLYVGLIADGVHLHDAATRIAYAAKGKDRIMLVTDAMPSVGTDGQQFKLQGKLITVRDGMCLYQNGQLAGADLDMSTAFRKMQAITGAPVVDVSIMASRTPARCMGVDDLHGSIAVGKLANFVHLDSKLQNVATWIGGREVTGSKPAPARSAA